MPPLVPPPTKEGEGRLRGRETRSDETYNHGGMHATRYARRYALLNRTLRCSKLQCAILYIVAASSLTSSFFFDLPATKPSTMPARFGSHEITISRATRHRSLRVEPPRDSTLSAETLFSKGKRFCFHCRGGFYYLGRHMRTNA